MYVLRMSLRVKKDSNVSVRVSGGIGYSAQGNGHCRGQALFWYKLIDYSFHKKIKIRSGEVLKQVLH